MTTLASREADGRVVVLESLRDRGIEPLEEREAVCRELRVRGYEEFADYLGRLPERAYVSVVSDVLE